VVAGITFGEGDLRLSVRTAAKYVLLKNNVHARTGKWIFITRPYGAGRTRAQQAYLRDGFVRRLPGFYYAAAPDTVQANHQDRGDGGHAFDINNWASVGERVIMEEARKVGLVRDPSERWHWNDNGAALASLGITPIEEDDMPLTRADKEEIAQLAAETTWNIQEVNPANGQRTRMGDMHRYAEYAGIKRRDEILAGVGAAVAAFPVNRPDLPPINGKAQQTQLGTMIGYLQQWVNQIDGHVQEVGGVALSAEQIEAISAVLAKSVPAPVVDEASIVRKVIAGVRGIFTRAGTEG
jgi:hypothetical protein